MSAYNRTRVVEFINEQAPALATLEKFKGLPTTSLTDSDVQSYIDRMKLTPLDIAVLLRIFKLVKIPAGNMFVHTESLCDRGDIKLGMKVSTDKFFELTPSIYKGIMCFTSCWLPNKTWTVRNDGKKFNISTNSTFLGKYNECFGRILIYRNTEELNMLFTGIQNLGGRKAFTYLITKLLLGSDYNFDFKGFSGMVRLPSICRKNCNPNCTTGLWGYEKSLIEQIWGYFLELAFYEKISSIPLSGMIINDASYDDVDNIELSGTEFRVFCIDETMVLESVMYKDKFFVNRVQYKKVLEKDIASYDPSNLTSVKRQNDTSLNAINSLLDAYCASRHSYGINMNIFDREQNPSSKFDKVFKLSNALAIDDDDQSSQQTNNLKQLELPQDSFEDDSYKNKYFKYKNKYFQFKSSYA